MQLYFYNGQPTSYQISKKGKLYNIKTKKWLKGQIGKNGYLTYNITTCKGKKRLYSHRMVMETYIPNPNSQNLEVNHKDLNKTNNSLENLEWVTSSQNKKHLYLNNKNHKSCTKIYCFNQEKKLIGEYKSLVDAVKIHNCSASTIQHACNSNPKIKAKGYYWSYSSHNNFDIIEKVPTGKSKPVLKIELKTGKLLAKYPSISEAARQNSIGRTHIGECCNNKIKSYKGFFWKFDI